MTTEEQAKKAIQELDDVIQRWEWDELYVLSHDGGEKAAQAAANLANSLLNGVSQFLNDVFDR